MSYCILSYSHKNTDISLRERLALDPKNPASGVFLKEIVENKFIEEALILSTCNRIEFILNASNPQKAQEYILSKLSDYSRIGADKLQEHADFYEDIAAIHHLFSVASSLDSLVIGETQISGQLKNAFKFSYDLGCCGLELSRAIHFAFRCAASVRNSTNISKNAVSVASVAVSKAKEILGTLKDREALVIGAGEMSTLCAKHLLNAGAKVILTNRDIDKANTLSKELKQDVENASLHVDSFKNIAKLINQIPLIFSATGAPHSIITKDMLEASSMERFWFDLAVPRDIEEIQDPKIKIFAVDDLQDIVKKNLAIREEQARIAYGIVGRFTQEFFDWLQSLNVDPIIKNIRQLAKDSALKELQRGISKGFLPKEYEKNIEKTLHNAFNAFLHQFTISLKNVANTPKGDSIVESVRFLFGGDDPKMAEKYKCEHIEEKSNKHC
ncbi:glutamyl-tRNA reductase [Helicobacter valdiviensis]|uniref:Glutamyl-tRNA reductase n=1 Tax=Helicobacter valdiviensis TaxID=1458358 RepID=A0A2W6MVK2_9HELI|nr:glutamyl-tRNA reductase [Helicobacter valdiviensis]PZT48554.1 glutamyl-tRNA reductase [Helicobacter valdiviensis]